MAVSKFLEHSVYFDTRFENRNYYLDYGFQVRAICKLCNPAKLSWGRRLAYYVLEGLDINFLGIEIKICFRNS